MINANLYRLFREESGVQARDFSGVQPDCRTLSARLEVLKINETPPPEPEPDPEAPANGGETEPEPDPEAPAEGGDAEPEPDPEAPAGGGGAGEEEPTPRVSVAAIETMRGALDDAIHECNDFERWLAERAETVLDDLMVAGSVQRVDELVLNEPADMNALNVITGSLQGSAAAVVDQARGVIELTHQQLTDYANGDISAELMSDYLTMNAANLGHVWTAAQRLIAVENSERDRVYQAHRNMSKAMRVPSMLDDETVRPVLYKIASPRLINVLRTEFTE